MRDARSCCADARAALSPLTACAAVTCSAFKPDGVIMFSDILTPLTGMNVPFDILAKEGPVVASPVRLQATP